MATEKTKARFSHLNPLFLVQDLIVSCAFYRDKLGFNVEFMYGEPAFFAGVVRSGIEIYLEYCAEREPSRTFRAADGRYDVYIFTDDVEALHQEYIEKKVAILRSLKTQAYGNREFAIQDNSGYVIVFAQSV